MPACLRLCVLVLFAPLSVADTPEAPYPCTAVADATPVCGFSRPPEDLEDLPGLRAVIVSEYGALSGKIPGELSLFDPDTQARRRLFGGSEGAIAAPPARERDTCPGAPGPEFSPHGVHVATIGGRPRLLVVNHGGREAVEIFDVTLGAAPGDVRLAWQDCVPAPDDAWLNDVVNLPGGGLAVTHMVRRGTDEHALLEAERTREITGHVLQWSPARGWEKVPGTEGGLPNGIEVSADGTTLYVNQYFGDRVSAIDRLSGTRLWSVEVPSPDNVTRAPTGELLVASHRAGLEAIVACAAHSERPCGVPYAVVSLDPATGAQRTLLEGAGAPMGAATVALQVGHEILLGSFVGERIVRRPRPD
ncbi:MAG: YncE family protein [Gammaproteobacteria bacterium]